MESLVDIFTKNTQYVTDIWVGNGLGETTLNITTEEGCGAELLNSLPEWLKELGKVRLFTDLIIITLKENK